MNHPFFFTSLTRISELGQRECGIETLARERWSNGDYVVAEVRTRAAGRTVELSTGRVIEVAEGDLLVGALGRREATLEATGTWEEVGPDGRMHVLSGGGILGKMTSRSTDMSPLVPVTYRGHAVVDGSTTAMRDWAPDPPEREWTAPTVLLVGTSMSAGKTTAARVIIRRLKRMGLRVLGAKLAGAGRWRDILTMRDAGADAIHDFVDAGLPSTVVPALEYRPALRRLLSLMAGEEPDVGVVEVGASPLEPYNGALAVRAIRDAIDFTVLCASDPYAVVGVKEAWEGAPGPDLVTGIASNTTAGQSLVRELTGIPCLDLRRKRARPELDEMLEDALGL